MAVADDAVNPSPPPPPPRVVVAVLVLLRFALAPMLALARAVLLAAGQALPYLGYAVVWVLAAASATQVVAARAWGQGSAPSVFLRALSDAAFKVFLCGVFLFLALAVVLLCGLSLASLVAVVSGSGSEFKKGTLGAFNQDSAREFSPPRAAVLGWFASMPFTLLVFAGSLMEVVMSSPVDGSISKGEMIGSVIVDVGLFGTSAISCFVVIPALALRNWRNDQSDRKAGLTV